MSPDPMGGEVTNPQSLNRYAYVLNNPVTFIDPLGLDCSDVINGVINCTSSASAPDPLSNGGMAGGGAGIGGRMHAPLLDVGLPWGGGGGGGRLGGAPPPSKPPNPSTTTIQSQQPPPKPTQTGKYSDYVGCVVTVLFAKAFGNGDQAGVTLVLHLAVFAGRRASPFFLPVSAIYDLNIELQTRHECMQEVYGAN